MSIRMQRTAIAAFALLSLGIFFVSEALARPISEATARIAATNWLQEKENHMQEVMGNNVGAITRYQGGHAGNIGYYLVTFNPNGWLILPADDEYWPIQSFGPGKMTPAEFTSSIWYAMTTLSETNGNVNTRGNSDTLEENVSGQRNQKRWASLVDKANIPTRGAVNLPSGEAADIRVFPILENTASWGQGTPFNALTDFNSLVCDTTISQSLVAASNDSFPVGCVALSMGQIMAHLARETEPRFPWGIYHVHDFSISKNYAPYGGVGEEPFNGIFGNPTYSWAKMCSIDPLQIHTEAVSSDVKTYIAPFLRDLGIANHLTYAVDGTGGYPKAKSALMFGFENAITVRLADSSKRILPTDRNNIIQTNLDLGHPVGLSFRGVSFAGHAAVIHGYAFDKYGGGEIDYNHPYYRINTGWSGWHEKNQRWYPDAGGWSYGLWGEISAFATKVLPTDNAYINYALLFNVFPQRPKNGTRQIIWPQIVSGRLVLPSVDDASQIEPVTEANVRPVWDDIPGDPVLTNHRGIFAFSVEANKSITVEMELPDGTWREIAQTETTVEPRRIDLDANYPDIPIVDFTSLTQKQVSSYVGNRWLGDVVTSRVVVLRGIYDTVGAVLTDMKIPHLRINQDDFIIANRFSLPKDGVLFVEGNEITHLYNGATPILTFDWEKEEKILAKINEFISAGGSVVMTENTYNVANTICSPSPMNMRFKAPGVLPIYGANTFQVDITLASPATAAVGKNTMRTSFGTTMANHTMLELMGNANSHGLGFYVHRRNWDIWTDYYSTMSYFTFAGGGKGYWSSHPFDKNYFFNGDDGKKLVEFQINWILDNTGITIPRSAATNTKRESSPQTMQQLLDGSVGKLNRGFFNSNYQYTGGRGIFTIESPSGRASSSSSLVADDGVLSRDVGIRKIGNDLVICMNGPSQRVDLPGWYNGSKPIQSLVFTDGTVWSASELESRAVPSEPLRNRTVVQIENKIEGTNKNDTLTGTAKNDVFLPGPGDDTMIGVAGSNVYFYEPGGGNDTIYNKDSTGIGGILRFHEDIVSADVKLSRQGDDVLLTFASGSVLVKDWYADATAKLGRIEFINDMTAFDVYDVELLVSGKPLVSRDEYYDTTVVTKPYGEYRESETPGANDGDNGSGGCNSGAFTVSVIGLLASALLIRSRRLFR